ncbi:response regulator [Pontibacter ramchanderi]|uniref:Response regulator receiver domain-containing protein n=1 Tax=Pontibacter ramchanderi TaxID=1179743 RepID=A0A2N3V0M3_9BACT|nr:response regulator [Pontibacter ramchanderi]PKV75143.1 response regulator receiver domain-containing protein [Pontibacter ramchanderi]
MTAIPKGPYILLIDDDSVTNFLHRSLIKDLNRGFEIVTCENGKTGLEFLERALAVNAVPYAIFVDLNMPVVDGFKFLEYYEKNNYPTLYPSLVTVLTTSNNPRDLEKLDAIDFVTYMGKPLTKQRLIDFLSK